MEKFIPNHIAIIPDGNRRWAKQNSLPSLVGHKKGFDNTIKIIDAADQAGVKFLTYYAFSTENWQRTKEEIGYLINLFLEAFNNYAQKLHQKNIRILHLGNREQIPANCLEILDKAVSLTSKNTGITLQLAISYGGRDEIVRAIKKIAAEDIALAEINEEKIKSHLDSDAPEPDLIIRTSGEQRLSNFLVWQAAYTELYFTDKYWPEFDENELQKAIDEYSRRQRRFGK
jgi:undecaprenyl diphosphate synthase